MCGIVGKYNLNGEPVSAELIEAMAQKIDYRGPDDSGVHIDHNIGLGHRRLSIIDLSELGHQPMNSADGSVWITYNGEIYNFQEIRKDLIRKGVTFRSSTDTEVIISLYELYQENCLEYLRGMFAFAIWDKNRERLFLARDRIGKKPLYYYFDGKSFLFASEMKSILEDPVVHKEINSDAFYDYFKYLYVPDPKTIYKNIFKLEPGHYLICTRAGIQKKEYWDISFDHQLKIDENQIEEELLRILSESVRLRMISDVPLGAFLSGGIDSSGVVALMAQHQSSPVTTCSIGFNSQKYDELEFARVIAQRFNTDHHEFIVQQNVDQILARLVGHFDEPFADASAVPTYYVSKIAKQQVTVALAGDGGDENFAGYDKYYFDDIENRLRNTIPGIFRRSLCPVLYRVLSKANASLLQKGATLCETLSREAAYGFFLTSTEFNNGIWDELILKDTQSWIGDYDPFSVFENYYRKANTDNHLLKILYTDLKCYLPGDILVKVDRMSMANSLEVRAPILDQQVVEFAFSISPDLKYKNGQKKYIFKHALERILPQEILYRKKMGFSVPLADWFRSEIKQLTRLYLLSNDANIYHFFDRRKIRTIWQHHQSGKRNYASVLWSLLMFELWYRNCFR